jgi:rod shape-determining protein MreD
MHRTTVWQRVDHVARLCVPISVTVFLLILGLIPLHAPGLPSLSPMYTLMAVYFWAVYRPEGFGFGAAFTIGVIEDLLVGTPLGSTALTLLVCQWVVLNQQKFFANRPFLEVWLAFTVIALGASMLRWFIAGVIGSGFPPVGNVFTSFMLTIVFYPVVGWLLARAQLRLMHQP